MLEMGHATLELFDEGYAEYIDDLEAGRRVSGPIRFALQVPDLHAALERLLAHGATVVHPPVMASDSAATGSRHGCKASSPCRAENMVLSTIILTSSSRVNVCREEYSARPHRWRAVLLQIRPQVALAMRA
jgi:hypothetical protein